MLISCLMWIFHILCANESRFILTHPEKTELLVRCQEASKFISVFLKWNDHWQGSQRMSIVKEYYCCRINRKSSSQWHNPPPSLSSWLISLEPAGPAGRGIWQRTSDNPEESWHRERQSLHRSRPDWKMLSMQRADETNQRSQEECLCRAG